MRPFKYSTPEDPTLAAYMQDLPQVVTGMADVMRLAAKLEKDPVVGLWQRALQGAIELLHPSELIFAMTWNAHCTTLTREAVKKSTDSHGVVFFSNMRFLYYRNPANIIEFPLSEIYTVAAHKGQYFDGISFVTPTLNIEVTFAGAIDRKLFRDMIIHIAANAACPLFAAGATPADNRAQVCECPGCGATVIIHPEIQNKCEYCNRLVQGQHIQEQSPLPTATNVAAELQKYKTLLDEGTISAEDFEAVKTKLLNKL
jgi:hypothetical protein